MRNKGKIIATIATGAISAVLILIVLIWGTWPQSILVTNHGDGETPEPGHSDNPTHSAQPNPGWDWGTSYDESGDRSLAAGESHLFGKEGCYTWWTNALALRFVGEKDQTYLSFVNEEGQMSVSSYNHKTGERADTTLASFERDDHNSAALTVLPDGRVLAVYARHNKDKLLRWRISQPEDITTFGPEEVLGNGGAVTYIQLHRISDSEYRVFYRYGNCNWATRVYNFVHNTWTEEIVWLREPDGGQYYLWTQEDKTVGKINVFMTSHPVNGTDQNIRYGYFDEKGNICTLDEKGNRKVLGTLSKETNPALSPRDFTVAFQAPEGISTRLYDVSFMGDRVAVLFGTFTDAKDSEYRYCYYDTANKKWVTNVVTTSGPAAVAGNRYFGGISFDKKDMQTLYVSRQVNKIWHIECWTTQDYGATWESKVLVEADRQGRVLMRPVIPYNTHEDMDFVYIAGRYPTYLTYNTDIYSYAD